MIALPASYLKYNTKKQKCKGKTYIFVDKFEYPPYTAKNAIFEGIYYGWIYKIVFGNNRFNYLAKGQQGSNRLDYNAGIS